jgi:hypothetical protein
MNGVFFILISFFQSKMPHVIDKGHTKLVYAPRQHSTRKRVTVLRIFCAGPGKRRSATSAPFGGGPFPSPAFAKPEGTDGHRDLSHGSEGILAKKSPFVNKNFTFYRPFYHL